MEHTVGASFSWRPGTDIVMLRGDANGGEVEALFSALCTRRVASRVPWRGALAGVKSSRERFIRSDELCRFYYCSYSTT
jgi:hypothetical protein